MDKLARVNLMHSLLSKLAIPIQKSQQDISTTVTTLENHSLHANFQDFHQSSPTFQVKKHNRTLPRVILQSMSTLAEGCQIISQNCTKTATVAGTKIIKMFKMAPHFATFGKKKAKKKKKRARLNIGPQMPPFPTT